MNSALGMAVCGPGFFRLALALFVFLSHASPLDLGFWAVLVFFMLSGYWISTMWSNRYSKARQPYVTYLVSRFWRLLPIFILSSAIAWGLLALTGRLPASVDPLRQMLGNILIFGYDSLSFQPIAPAWSLDIEAQFYLVAPLLILVISRYRWVVALCLAVAVLAHLFHDRISVARYLFFFALGVTSAQTGWRPDRGAALAGAGIALGLVLACVASPWSGMILVGAEPGPLSAYNRSVNTLIALAMFPWAMYTTGQRGSRFDPFFGDLSYLVYLLHKPVVEALDLVSGLSGHRFLQGVAALFLVLSGSWLIHEAVDAPSNRIRARWVAGRLPFTATA